VENLHSINLINLLFSICFFNIIIMHVQLFLIDQIANQIIHYQKNYDMESNVNELFAP